MVEKVFESVDICADWRFLLNIPQQASILLLLDSQPAYVYLFEKTAEPQLILSALSTLAQRKSASEQLNRPIVHSKTSSLPFGENTIDLIICLDYIPGKGSFTSVLHCLKPGGAFVSGFMNPFTIWRNVIRKTQSPPVSQIAKLLTWIFFSTLVDKHVYGLFPDIFNPEIIFPLKTREIHFVMKRILRHKVHPTFFKLFRYSFFIPFVSLVLPAFLFILEKKK
jgi:hypothetical protein